MSEGCMRLDASPQYACMVDRMVTGIGEGPYHHDVLTYMRTVERIIDSPACIWIAVTF